MSKGGIGGDLSKWYIHRQGVGRWLVCAPSRSRSLDGCPPAIRFDTGAEALAAFARRCRCDVTAGPSEDCPEHGREMPKHSPPDCPKCEVRGKIRERDFDVFEYQCPQCGDWLYPEGACLCWVGHGDCGGCSGYPGIAHEPACGWEWNPDCPLHEPAQEGKL
jgi:hypothetical protein